MLLSSVPAPLLRLLFCLGLLLHLARPATAQNCPIGFTMHGTAAPTGTGCYRLTTQGAQDVQGAIWSDQTISLTNDFDFTFGVNQCGAADGVVFVLHRAGPTVTTGEQGGSLSYYRGNGAFSQSVGIELDFYQNTGAPYNDPVPPHAMLALNGDPGGVLPPVLLPTMNNCADHLLRIRWSVAAQTLTADYDGQQLFSNPRNLVATVFGGNPSVWFGFVGSTGGSTADQTICPVNIQAVPAAPAIVPDGPTTLCPGGQVGLRINNLPAGTTFQWSPAAGLSAATGASVTVAPAASTTYRVLATTPTGCQSQDSVRVAVLPRPNVTVSPRQVVCFGGSATLLASAPLGLSHTWTPATGLSAPVGREVIATPSVSTLYTVTTTGPGYCLRQDTVRVVVRPALGLRLTADPAAAPGASTRLAAASAAPGITFTWSPAAGLSATTGPEVTATPAQPTTYTVTATGPGGCTEQASVLAQPFLLPNVITPNHDGRNDSFQALVSQLPVRLQVFSRWGRLVYEQENYRNQWGPDAAPGVYYYRLSTADGQSWKGWVEVVR
jgi:gliding motility-associated-like protein